MLDRCRRTSKSIRMRDDVYYLAKVAAVASRKTLGQWLEDAITEKLDREPYWTPPTALENSPSPAS